MHTNFSAHYRPSTVEEVFSDYKGRRVGIIKALTNDFMEFYEKCDPEKGHLCLYGLPDEKWEVDFPAAEVPTDLPEPVLGINLARDNMPEREWLSMVAMHSDSWLLSMTFRFASRVRFDREDRERLFDLINNLPTVYEVCNGSNCNKPKSGSKGRVASQPEKHSDDEEVLGEMVP